MIERHARDRDIPTVLVRLDRDSIVSQNISEYFCFKQGDLPALLGFMRVESCLATDISRMVSAYPQSPNARSAGVWSGAQGTFAVGGIETPQKRAGEEQPRRETSAMNPGWRAVYGPEGRSGVGWYPEIPELLYRGVD